VDFLEKQLRIHGEDVRERASFLHISLEIIFKIV
jgi:hypothetical protein